MADREARRLSFGSAAADYDRYRPSPPPQALDWLIPPGAGVVLDLAAGTGAVTRELIGRVTRVVAIEPDERMRTVLAARRPEAEVLAGCGEGIPLPSASVDGVLISSAWHWLDPEQAVPEITRVLRVGGTLGVIGMSWDRRVPWVAELNALDRDPGKADCSVKSPHGEVKFPPGAPLSEPETFTVEYARSMTSEELVGLLGTYSRMITLDPERRADFSRRVRAFLDRQPWEQVDLPMICRCLRSTRLPASAGGRGR